jgi:hypothetical protein
MDWKDFLNWLKGKQVYIEWRIGPVSTRQKTVEGTLRGHSYKKDKESASMSLVMTTTQECPLEVAFKDAHGNPAPVENIIWGSSDENIIKVNANDAEPQKAIVLAVGTVGTGQVNVKADARTGEGVNLIVGLLDVEILPAEATVVEISAGTPIETPHPEPHGETKRSRR